MSSQKRSARVRRERVKPGVYRRRNHDGSTVYEIVYRDSNGRQRLETVGSRLREAEDRLAVVKGDMARGSRIAPRRDLTVADAAERWLASTEHLRPTTRGAYRASLDTHVLPAFGRRRLEAVTPDDVARWTQRMRTVTYRSEADRRAYPATAEDRRPTTPLRAATIGLALKTLHRVYAHAIRRQGFAGTSPVAALERAERPTDDPKTKIILTPAQLAEVIDAATPTYQPVLAFLAGTGCRLGEALGVTWSDLDLAEGTARIAMQLDRSGHRQPLKTKNARRTLDCPTPSQAGSRVITAQAATPVVTSSCSPPQLVPLWTTATSPGGVLSQRARRQAFRS